MLFNKILIQGNLKLSMKKRHLNLSHFFIVKKLILVNKKITLEIITRIKDCNNNSILNEVG